MSFERDPSGGPVAVLALVKPTQFEAIAAKATADNEKRNGHIEWLETIMTTYSYVMCILETNPHLMTLDDVKGTIKYIKEVVVKENINITKDSTGYFRIRAEYELGEYLWKQTGYSKSRDGNIERVPSHDILLNKSVYWDQWRKVRIKSEGHLTSHRIQEDLWDQEKEEIRYDRLADFVKNYPWAFPPNVVELHKEWVASQDSESC